MFYYIMQHCNLHSAVAKGDSFDVSDAVMSSSPVAVHGMLLG